MVQASGESANLDMLRATAVLCVFFHHLKETWITGTTGDLSWHFGQLGVLIFFVHTSLVLMFSMERLRLNGSALVTAFYIRRWFRIYPLSMFCVLCTYCWLPWMPGGGKWIAADLWTNLTLTQNLFHRTNIINVFWTLPLEVQMYIFLPFLFFFCKKRSVAYPAGFWFASIALAILQSKLTPRLNVFSYVPCFLGGVIAWRLIRQFETCRFSGWLWPIGMAASTSIWMTSTLAHDMVYRWLFGIGLGLTIPWFRELSWKPLNIFSHVIAKYSYGIYLSHPVAMLFSFSRLQSYHPAVRWGCFIALAIGVPLAMYHCIESPMIRFGRNVSRQLKKTLRDSGEPPKARSAAAGTSGYPAIH